MAPSDLSARIRSDVEQGRPRDEIVASLLERGLSQASAERFVDRAIAAHEAGPVSPPATPASATEDEEDAGGRGSLISGAFWLSVGCSVTGITYLLAKPGGKYTVMYGAVVVGLVAFGRGLMRFWSIRPEPPFPWKAVSIAALVPLIGMVVLVGFVKGRAASRRASQERAVEQAAAAVQEARDAGARAAEERAQAEADVARATRMSQERAQVETARVTRILKSLRDPRSVSACTAALDAGHTGVREAIPDLYTRLRDSSDPSTQGCAATGLVALGEIDEPLAFYVASSQAGNEDLRRSAITGFGSIGPRAAAAGLPFLVAESQSPNSTHRYLAVEALAKMGPEGVAGLRGALNDSDPLVKNRATAALAAMGER
jgi:hypothetical protein